IDLRNRSRARPRPRRINPAFFRRLVWILSGFIRESLGRKYPIEDEDDDEDEYDEAGRERHLPALAKPC
ncbi:MAG: hypothetical protein WBZ19_20525, partial [Chthoniobacterales bacterium]